MFCPTCERCIIEDVVWVSDPLIHGIGLVPGHVPRLLVHPVVLSQQLVECLPGWEQINFQQQQQKNTSAQVQPRGKVS